MADVIHRTTLEFRRSVNDPDYPEPTWKINPNMSAVAGVPSIYWKAPPDWSGDVGPVEMTQPEKDAVDAAAQTSARDALAAQLDEVEDVLRAFALTMLDELNNHKDKINAILDAADNANNLASFKADMAAITDYPTRTIAQLKTSVRNKLGT